MAEAGELQAAGIMDLPVDLLAACLDLVGGEGADLGLQAVELTCKRFRQADSQLRRATPALDASVLFKHLWAALQASPRRRALFGAPLAVTSTDDPREHVGNVLDPVARSRSRMCYWSSAGSDEVGSSEAIVLGLRPRLSLVTGIQLRPFRAWFQPGSPIYAPQRLRICVNPAVGGEPFENINNEKLQQAANAAATPGLNTVTGEYVSLEFAVRQSDELQTFALPPTLCFGHELRVDLLGRTQRQEADGRYYTCVSFIRVLGTPLDHFSLLPPRNNQKWTVREFQNRSSIAPFGGDPGSADEAPSESSHSDAASQTDPDEEYNEFTELEVAPLGAVDDPGAAAAAMGLMPWEADWVAWAQAAEAEAEVEGGESENESGSGGEDEGDM